MKNKLIFIIGIIIFGLIFLPFTFSDEMTYVKKGSQSIYVEYTYFWLLISTCLMIVFSVIGIFYFVERFLNSIDKND